MAEIFSPDALRPRKEAIDHLLARAGWSLQRGNLSEHFMLPSENQGRFSDYVLVCADKKPLAIVEYRQTCRDLLEGKRQATEYALAFESAYGFKPFVYLADGEHIWFLDATGQALRSLPGFHSPSDLSRLDFQRRSAQPLASLQPSAELIRQPFQFEAVNHIRSAIMDGQRRFLLAMPGGTGRLPTTLALVALLMRASVAQRVLFLTDRRDLVRQALRNADASLPRSAGFDPGERFHIATYPGMAQIYQQLSIGIYDLLVADESRYLLHERFQSIFDHFDTLTLGLTTTPADFIDPAIYRLFCCPNNRPTFNYGYQSAVDDGCLARYEAVRARTQFKIGALKAGRLPSRLSRQLGEQGLEAGEISFDATDLERRMSNAGTCQAVIREIVERCRPEFGGSLPAKTIVYALSHTHALELLRAFDSLYPHWIGQAAVIDDQADSTGVLLRDFKQAYQPRIAITSGLLDAGDSLPAVLNLVFVRPVFSPVTFWQMIATGTRINENKRDFLVLDFCGNFEYLNLQPGEESASLETPLPVRLFRLRLDTLIALRAHHQPAVLIQAAIARLQSMLAAIPVDSLEVQPLIEALRQWQDPSSWQALDPESIAQLKFSLAPLLRFLPGANLDEMAFEASCEQLTLAHLEGDPDAISLQRERILRASNCLPPESMAVQAQAELLTRVKDGSFWEQLDCQRIVEMQSALAPLMRDCLPIPRQVIHLDLPDRIVSRLWIIFGTGNEGAQVQPYRDQVEARVRELGEHYPALRKIQFGEALSDDDLKTLAYLLAQSGLATTDPILRQAYQRPNAYFFDFLRHILSTIQIPNQEDIIALAFDQFIASRQPLDDTQLQFIRLVHSFAVRHARLALPDLQHTPFTRVGQVEQLFSHKQQADLLEFSNQFTAK